MTLTLNIYSGGLIQPREWWIQTVYVFELFNVNNITYTKNYLTIIVWQKFRCPCETLHIHNLFVCVFVCEIIISYIYVFQWVLQIYNIKLKVFKQLKSSVFPIPKKATP